MPNPLSFLTSPRAAGALALTAVLIGGLSAAIPSAQAGRGGGTWKKIAKKLRASARTETKADYLLALARATAMDEDEADEFLEEAREEFEDGMDLAKEQYGARLELADDLDEDEPYAVEIDPNDFVEGVDNPFMPLVPGTTRTYRAQTEDGTETIVVTVLDETKEILGVECTVVRDTVTLDGELVEDTLDWFAQDTDGNVWYFGEIALNYEDGDITDVDGSWIAGKDGAMPGIVMQATRTVGHIYRQEFLMGEAEDFAEILSVTASATVPYGSFTNCLQTFDGTPMEPDAQEHKYYASGVGVVLEVDVESGERVELISVTTE